MRLAIIDLGTNSIRFDIHEISVNRKGTIQHRRLYREKAMVRLGQNLFLDGKLNPESRRRTLEAIQSFADTMAALKVNRTIAFGTAAMRDASDGEQFLAEIEKQTKVHFRIITGAEEASLIAKGILSLEVLPKGNFALIDIGGGSTEVSICKGNKVLHAYSFNLGVAKLQQVFLKTQPPGEIKVLATKKKKVKKRIKTANPVVELRSFIKSVVLPKIVIEHWPKVNQIIGSSGSVIALAKLVNRDKDAFAKPFESKNLHKTVEIIKSKTPAELLSMRGMEPKRVDLILAGGVLLDEIAQMLKAKTIRTTDFALRDGILVDELIRYQNLKKKTAGFSLDEIEKRTEAWGVDRDHFANVRSNAEWLFDSLKPVHKLGVIWKPYLIAAAILHDVGETISHAHHAEHSEYMVKNADFVGMRPWESQFIAGLCRLHKEEKVLEKKNEKKIPFEPRDELRPVFFKLLSILQMADAIDRTHKKVLTLKKAKIGRTHIELKFTSKYPCDLEILRFEQKKTLFETLFKKEITLSK